MGVRRGVTRSQELRRGLLKIVAYSTVRRGSRVQRICSDDDGVDVSYQARDVLGRLRSLVWIPRLSPAAFGLVARSLLKRMICPSPTRRRFGCARLLWETGHYEDMCRINVVGVDWA